MKTLLLSADPHSFSTTRLFQEFLKRDHQAEVLPLYSCEIGARLVDEDFDLVVPPLGARETHVTHRFLKKLEEQGTLGLNPLRSILKTQNKWSMYQELADSNLPLPKTWIAHGEEGFQEAWEEARHNPLLIKGIYGARNNSIFLSPHPGSASKIVCLPEFHDLDYIIQEFVGEAQGEVTHALVIGGEVRTSVRCQKGSSVLRPEEIPEHEDLIVETRLDSYSKRLCELSAQALNLNFASVELISSDSGPLVLEVNSCPDFEAVEIMTHAHVAEELVDLGEQMLLSTPKRKLRDLNRAQ